MNNDQFFRDRWLLLLTFSVIAFIGFFPLFFTGFATADDLNYYLITRRGEIWRDTSYFAQMAGRFYFWFVRPVYSLPYLIDNILVIKLFQYIPLFICFLLFAKIIHRVTQSAELALMFLLIFLTTFQVSEHTSLFVAYPFYFTFSFILLLLSYLSLLTFYKSGRRKYFVLSLVLFIISLQFYEAYLLFLVFAGVLILKFNLQGNKVLWVNVRTAALHFLPFLVVALLYVTVYFVFRTYYPSQYAGTKFSSGSVTLATFFKVLWDFSFTSFPLRVYETTKTLFSDKSELVSGFSPVLLNLFLTAKVEWLVKGVLISLLGYRLLLVLPRLNVWKSLSMVSIAMLLIFMPHIPMALTEKYTYLVTHIKMLGYLTTFFSFFGTLLLLTVLVSNMVNLFNVNKLLKKIVSVGMVIFFFTCSVLTDFSNYSIAKDIRSANLRFYAIDELVKTDEFKSIPAWTPFYARTLWDNPSESAPMLTEQDFNWYLYFEARTGTTYPFAREDKFFLDYCKKKELDPWMIVSRQAVTSDDLMLVLAKMKRVQPQDTVVDRFADRAMVLYYSPYKVFTISFRLKNEQGMTRIPVSFNTVTDTLRVGTEVEMTVFCTRKDHKATHFILEAPGIDLTSINISNMVNPANYTFYLAQPKD